MATSKSATDTLSLSECTVVDVDSHVGKDLEGILPYLDQSVRDVFDRLPSLDQASWKVFTSSRATPEFPNNVGAGDYNESLEHEHAQDAETKLEYMDKFDIEYSVLTPGILGLASVNNEHVAVDFARAHNDWLTDRFLDVDERLKATIMVAHQKPDRAAEEIDRWGDEDDVVGVALPASGLVPPAGHYWHDPIYEAAQDNDLPIIMHTGNSTATAAFPVQRYWSQNFTEDHLFTFPVEGMWHLGSLMFRGVPERFPDLQFVLQETGVEWLPWMEWRMDDHYLQNSVDIPILNRRPSEYLHDNFWFSTQPLGHTDRQADLADLLRIAGGGDMIMFATDHPHPDFDTPEELFTPLQGHLNNDDIRGMMGESAIEVFGI